MNFNKEIKELLNEYSIKKKQVENQALQNFYDALKIEELKQIYIQIKNKEIDIAKELSTNLDVSAHRNALTKLNQQKNSILKKHSIDQSLFTPKYSCSQCKDSGIVDSKLCKCINQDWLSRSMQKNNIDMTGTPSISNYKTAIYDPKDREFVNKLKKFFSSYINNFESTPIKTITLLGETGVGKTFLSKVVAKELINKGHLVYHASSFYINNLFLKYHSTFDIDKHQLLNPLLEPQLLIIDDWGSEPMFNNVTKEYLLLILNERISKNKHTIITTNLDINDILERYEERIFSRITDKSRSKFFKIESKDLRNK